MRYIMGNGNIAGIIKELRNRQGLTQEQLIRIIGITFITMNNRERVHRSPHPFLLKKLLSMANKLGVNISNDKRTRR